ncbi:CDC48 family AAA ATPase [Conexivisphaera calida]|uniref:Cell division protein FtsH n=1 Tax=Conexivisphaera calida TaxID=1874277 RepID=A0A4V0P1G6_9ARCH|nr:CDC48 family AAA ATPase [Conexivisphaera calida]BBE41650.1 Cell division protein FtsH [Conexivisphaera calida]
MAQKWLRLVAKEAAPKDVGKSRARLNPKIFEELNLKSGDIVEIRGKSSTAALAWPSEETPSDSIRIDGITRRNAGVSLNDYVEIRRVKRRVAERVVLSSVGEELKVDEDFLSFLKNRLIGMPLHQDNIASVVLLGNPVRFKVISLKPSAIAVVDESTEIVVERSLPAVEGERVTYDDIGGLSDQLMKLREMVELPLRHPEFFRRLGIDPPRGVLLYGPPGCGKTLIAKALANESGARFFVISGPEVMSKFYGESEARLREIFREAKEKAPSIIFIDEIDAIAPKREEVTGEVEKRVVAQLLALMDGMEAMSNIIVIGATNRIDDIDPALRRPGRFDREIEIGVPNQQGRLEILQIHTRGMPLAKDVDLKEVSRITHGYTGADLKALCREAAMNALRRTLPKDYLEMGEIPASVLEKIRVTQADFSEAMKAVGPSALREFYAERSPTSFGDIGGASQVKAKLFSNLVKAIKDPESFRRLGIDPPRGVLLYGPPGCGKTLIAKALANESGANLILVRGPELLSKWVGESERAIRGIFKKAVSASPTVIVFDEIDALAPSRAYISGGWSPETIVSQLITELDGLEDFSGVYVIGTTNRPELMDAALLRPGRFDLLIYVPPPGAGEREEILRLFTRRVPLAENVDLGEIARRTEGYTGADLKALVREAALNAISEDRPSVEHQDFERAQQFVRPTVTKEMLEYFSKLEQKLNSRIYSEARQPYL